VVGLVPVAALVVALLTAALVARHERLDREIEAQADATSLARAVDLKLSTYHAALETVAQSYSLRKDFDLERVEWEARRVGALFGGSFILLSVGEQLQQLMNTRSVDGVLPPPYPATDRPDIMRAFAESVLMGRPVTADAFKGAVANRLVVTTVKAIDIPQADAALLGFSVTLDEITAWLAQAPLRQGNFAALADGSRRVIARSSDNERILLADLPDWFIGFSAGRDKGVAIGPPIMGGAPRLFAMQRLEVAPRWTLVVSHPLPAPASILYRSAWPGLSGLFVLLLGSSIAALILDRRRAEAEAVRSAAAATERGHLLAEVRAANARKARLMAVLAHDLRTPLIAVLGTLDQVRDAPEGASKERLLARIKQDGHGMLRLIDDVLELARLGAGEARLRPEPFALSDLLDQVAEAVGPQAARQGTTVEVQADAFPALLGDVMALRRVLLNFATNAVKATRGGSIRLTATGEATGAGGHAVTLAVTDTGRGIAPEDIPQLFRDFGMLERDGGAAEGTGLGLAICRRLAAAMGGEVGVDSTPGAGSRFWLRVTLPEAGAVPAAPEETPEAPIAALAGLRVLVAEDHDTIRQLTCAALARAGLRVTEAADGESAVALAETRAFDLILMDIQMPGLEGDKAAAQIRCGTGPSARTRIIGITAHQTPEIAVMLSDFAFDACLRKPLDLGQLAALVAAGAPPPPAPASTEDFDAETLAYLHDIDGGALLAKSLRSFSGEIDRTRAELGGLVARRDTSGAARLVHKLVGFAEMIGARTLSADLRKFEATVERENPDALDEGLQRLADAMTQAQAEIERLATQSNLAGPAAGGGTA